MVLCWDGTSTTTSIRMYNDGCTVHTSISQVTKVCKILFCSTKGELTWISLVSAVSYKHRYFPGLPPLALLVHCVPFFIFSNLTPRADKVFFFFIFFFFSWVKTGHTSWRAWSGHLRRTKIIFSFRQHRNIYTRWRRDTTQPWGSWEYNRRRRDPLARQEDIRLWPIWSAECWFLNIFEWGRNENPTTYLFSTGFRWRF